VPRPGRAELPPLQKSVCEALLHFLTPNQVPEGQGNAAVTGVRSTWRGSFFVPFLYLACISGVPGVAFPAVLAVPGRRRAVVCGNRFTFTQGAGLEAEGVCVLPVHVAGRCRGHPRWRPWSAEDRPAAGAVCSRGSAAPASVRWRGRRLDRHREDVATYGDGLVGHRSAGSRPARSPGLRRDCPLPARMAASRLSGGTGNDPQSGETV
jgi:hypothetical protein